MKQLPAYSPVSLSALMAGAGAMLGGGAGARKRVLARLREEYPAHGALLTDSGTNALRLGLEAVAQPVGQPGRAPLVALPAYGCFDLGTAAVGAGCRIVFYDVAPATLGPDWPSFERAMHRQPDAVVIAHWYGVPTDVERAAGLAATVGAVVIDDAAQGVGASIRGRNLGSFGDVGVLSFGRGKGRTGGGGGALLANSARGAELLSRIQARVAPPPVGLRQATVLMAQWLFGRPSLYWIPASLPFLGLGETPWHDPSTATGIPAFAAGALLATWDDSLHEVSNRRKAAALWRNRLTGVSWPDSEVEDAQRGELRVPVLAPTRDGRDESLRTIPGAMPGYPTALPDLPQLQSHIESAGDVGGARTLVERLWTLPAHRWVS